MGIHVDAYGKEVEPYSFIVNGWPFYALRKNASSEDGRRDYVPLFAIYIK